MKVLHIVPGVDDIANGMAVVARFLAKEQGEAEVDDLNHGIHRIHGSSAEEVWIHGMWLPKEWLACWRTLRSGKRLVRMPHGSVDPVRLRYHGWKKWLVGPIERWCLRRCSKIVATCEAEAEWIRAYEPRVKSIEVTDIKRFFDLPSVPRSHPSSDRLRGSLRSGDTFPVPRPPHLLYLGRRHPLKGVEYLETAVRQIQESSAPLRLCARIISNAFGEEKEKVWDWCDVLVLPTLSENFGLVVAEALERGKSVITTDGAPAWNHGIHRIHGNGMGEVGNHEIHETHEKGLWSGYGGRLIYLKGYRDGTDEERVELLKNAIERIGK